MKYFTIFLSLSVFLAGAIAVPFSKPVAPVGSGLESLFPHSSSLTSFFGASSPIRYTQCPTTEQFTCCHLYYVSVAALNACVCGQIGGSPYQGTGCLSPQPVSGSCYQVTPVCCKWFKTGATATVKNPCDCKSVEAAAILHAGGC